MGLLLSGDFACIRLVMSMAIWGVELVGGGVQERGSEPVHL